jgi:hypothetical protein
MYSMSWFLVSFIVCGGHELHLDVCTAQCAGFGEDFVVGRPQCRLFVTTMSRYAVVNITDFIVTILFFGGAICNFFSVLVSGFTAYHGYFFTSNL